MIIFSSEMFHQNFGFRKEYELLTLLGNLKKIPDLTYKSGPDSVF